MRTKRNRKLFDRRYRRRKLHRVPGKTYTDLAAYIDETGDTLMNIAARCRTTASYLSRIMNGLCVPRPRLATRIARYTGVPVLSFTVVWLKRNGTRSERERISA